MSYWKYDWKECETYKKHIDERKWRGGLVRPLYLINLCVGFMWKYSVQSTYLMLKRNIMNVILFFVVVETEI